MSGRYVCIRRKISGSLFMQGVHCRRGNKEWRHITVVFGPDATANPNRKIFCKTLDEPCTAVDISLKRAEAVMFLSRYT